MRDTVALYVVFSEHMMKICLFWRRFKHNSILFCELPTKVDYHARGTVSSSPSVAPWLVANGDQAGSCEVLWVCYNMRRLEKMDSLWATAAIIRHSAMATLTECQHEHTVWLMTFFHSVDHNPRSTKHKYSLLKCTSAHSLKMEKLTGYGWTTVSNIDSLQLLQDIKTCKIRKR